MGCRARRSPAELLRVVRGGDGDLALGVPGQGGRGAWLCADRIGCLEAASKAGFSRAFRTAVSAPQVEALRARLAGRGRIEIRCPATGDDDVT